MHGREICSFCGMTIDAGREFVYEFESLQFCDDHRVLEFLRESSNYYGEPLRLCRTCNESISGNRSELFEEKEHIVLQTKLAQKSCIIVGIIFVLIYSFIALVNALRNYIRIAIGVTTCVSGLASIKGKSCSPPNPSSTPGTIKAATHSA
jgi:hypothetical protein